MKNEADRSAINKDATGRKSELANDERKVGRKWRVGFATGMTGREKRERALFSLSPKFRDKQRSCSQFELIVPDLLS